MLAEGYLMLKTGKLLMSLIKTVQKHQMLNHLEFFQSLKLHFGWFNVNVIEKIRSDLMFDAFVHSLSKFKIVFWLVDYTF